MIVSLVIPTFTVNEDLLAMALICANSFRPFVDELIICEDTNSYIKELHEISDIYITHPNYQMAKNANQGWRAARGDYIGGTSADSFLVRGNPRDLCIPDALVMPQVLRRNVTQTSCFFIVHRPLYERLGMWNETLKWSGTDTDLFGRYEKHSQMNPEVIIDTENASPGSSYRARGFAENWP